MIRITEKDIYINTSFITLQSALKFAGVSITGGEAKVIVENGFVMINGAVCTMRGKKLYENDVIEVKNIGFVRIRKEK